MAHSIFTEWVELGPRGSGLGILCPGRTMGRRYRCWGMGGPRVTSLCLAPQTWKTCLSWSCGPKALLPSSMTISLSSMPPALMPSGHVSSMPVVSLCPSSPVGAGTGLGPPFPHLALLWLLGRLGGQRKNSQMWELQDWSAGTPGTAVPKVVSLDE